MSISVFSYIGETINNATKAFITDGLQSFIDTLTPFVILCVTLHIMLKCYVQIVGKSDDVLKDVVIHCVVVICITTLSLNVANYTEYLIGAVNGWADGLTSGIIGGSGVDVFKTLDDLLSKGVQQAAFCFQKMSIWHSESWDWVFAGLAVLITLGAVSLISGIIIIGSKFLLMLLFLLGPLFLTLACFPVTRRFFDSWVSKLMENCLVQVFGIAIVSLSAAVIEHFLKTNNLEGDANPLAIAAQIMIVAGIMGFVIRQIPNLAGSLAGGFASGAMTLRDVMKPASAAAGMAAGFMAGRGQAPSDAADVGSRQTWDQQQSNNISRGSTSTSKDAVKRDQLVKDMIAQQTRKNMASNGDRDY